MNILHKFFSNARKPQGFLGRMMLRKMNEYTHAKLATWALRQFDIQTGSQVLDIGCGGGANIDRLIHKADNVYVTGIDFSPESVAFSTKYNADHLKDGRCSIIESSVETMPFDKNTFDIVTAFETVYFWPDIEHTFKHVYAVTKPRGRFVIVNEDDGEKPNGSQWDGIIEGMHTYTISELEELLKKSGFANITVTRELEMHWICIIAEKPNNEVC